MNNKGFTLVELLAMLVVLALLMAITIPNISGIISNQRLNTVRNDATTMVETAKTKVAKDELIKRPENNRECLIFTLNYLNDNENIEKGPNGLEYDQYESFVAYVRVREGSTNRFKYYVRLAEKKDESTGYGFEFEDISNVKENKSDNIKEFSLLNIDKTNISDLSSYDKLRNVCTNVKKIYIRND